MRRFIALIIVVFVAISVNGAIAQSAKETKDNSDTTKYQLNCKKSAREYLEFAESAYDEGQYVKRNSMAADAYLNAVFARGTLAAHLYRICSELEQQNQKSVKPNKK